MKIIPCVWKIVTNEGKGMAADLDCPRIHLVGQISGPDKYAIRKHGRCLNVDAEWEYEPRPSSRDEDFMKRCRFDSFSEAYTTLTRRIYG